MRFAVLRLLCIGIFALRPSVSQLVLIVKIEQLKPRFEGQKNTPKIAPKLCDPSRVRVCLGARLDARMRVLFFFLHTTKKPLKPPKKHKRSKPLKNAQNHKRLEIKHLIKIVKKT